MATNWIVVIVGIALLAAVLAMLSDIVRGPWKILQAARHAVPAVDCCRGGGSGFHNHVRSGVWEGECHYTWWHVCRDGIAFYLRSVSCCGTESCDNECRDCVIVGCDNFFRRLLGLYCHSLCFWLASCMDRLSPRAAPSQRNSSYPHRSARFGSISGSTSRVNPRCP